MFARGRTRSSTFRVSAPSPRVTPLSKAPNLFVIGAMKAGTTTFHTLLSAHPQIFMSDPKEPTHFVDGEELRTVSRRAWEAGYWRDRARYLGLFEGAGDATYRGESSTAYSKLPRLSGVAERIARFAPDARIVYMMRDPVERTLSHYLHAVRWNDETRPPIVALRAEPHYREVSDYARQLEPYLRLMGKERVKVFTSEALRADQPGIVKDVFAWLGVDPSFSPPDPGAQNVTDAVVMRRRGPGFLIRLRATRWAAAARRRLPRRVYRAVRRVTASPLSRTAPDMLRAADLLRAAQQEEVIALTELLGRAFPEWTTLHASRPEAG